MVSQPESRQMTLASCFGNPATNRSWVSSTGAWASFSMKARRSFGYAGSRGTNAPPALRMPSNPMTISNERSTQMATSTSGPTPSVRK